MPEGHTIHRAARDQAKLLVGERLRVTSPQGRFAAGAERLDGRTLTGITPYGKHLWYDVTGILLHVHLGLYGRFTKGRQPSPAPRGALRLRMETDESWVDLRGPTACDIVTEAQRDMVLARLGPDPLARRSDPRTAFAHVNRSRSTISALLLDQRVIAGVGNVYRAEVLFRTGTSPFVAGKDLGEDRWRCIWDDLVSIMQAGVRSGRIMTVRPADRPQGPLTRGKSHYVYRRQGLPCRICGAPIATGSTAGRSIAWCPLCQGS